MKLTKKQLSQSSVTFTLTALAIVALTVAVFQSIPRADQSATHITWQGSDFATWQQNGTTATNSGLTLARSSSTARQSKLPSPRYGVASAINPETNKLYMFGGESENESPNQDILEYDTTTDTLTTKQAKLPKGKSFVSAVWDPGAKVFYLIGGLGNVYDTDDGRAIIYDPATDTTRYHSAEIITHRRNAVSVGVPLNNTLSQISIFGGLPFDIHTGAQGTARNHAMFLPNAQPGTPYMNPYPAPEVPNDQQQIPTVAAVFDPDNRYIYIIASGNSLDSPLEFYVYNIALGYIQRVNVDTSQLSTNGMQGFTAVYVPPLKKTFIMGGSMQTSFTNDGIERQMLHLESQGIFELSIGNVTSQTGPTGSLTPSAYKLPSPRSNVSAVWSQQTNSIFVIGGHATLGDFTNPGNFGSFDEIVEYKLNATPSYQTTGSATIVHTPLGGVMQEWKTAQATFDAVGQSLTLEYSNDTSCITGFTPTITELTASESICVRATFGTDDPLQSPILTALTITFGTASPPEGTFPYVTVEPYDPGEPLPIQTGILPEYPQFPGEPIAIPFEPIPAEPTDMPTETPETSPTTEPEPTVPETITSLCIENIELKNRPSDASHARVRVTITNPESNQTITSVTTTLTTTGQLAIANLALTPTTAYRMTIKPEGYLSQTFVAENLTADMCLGVPTLAKFRAGDFRDNDDKITLKDISAAIAARSAATPDEVFQLVYPATDGKPGLGDISTLIADYKASTN